MIGIFHIRNLQPRLPFFSRNTRFRRISRYKFLLSAKDLCHQFFKIPFSGILSCIQRTPIKADSPSQKVVGTPHAVYDSENDLYSLHLKVKMEDNFSVRMGGSVSTTSSNQIYLGLGYQDLNYYSKEITLDGQIGKVYNNAELMC